MLRYFYLLFLLVCIKSCFCYNYIQNQDLGYNLNDRQLSRVSIVPSSHRRRPRHRLAKRRRNAYQDYEELDHIEPSAQFDLVNFLQKPNQEKEREDAEYSENEMHKREERQSESHNNYKPILKPNYEEDDDKNLSDLENLDRSFSKINQELKLNSLDIRQLYPTALIHRELNIGDVRNLDRKNFKRNSDPEGNKVHVQRKKCIANHLKFPFFSHKKQTVAKKKTIPKKEHSTTESKRTEETKLHVNEVTPTYNTLNERKIKRSATDFIYCPVCKHKFTMDELELMKEPQDTQDTPVHNSRQYYQRIQTRQAPKNEKNDEMMLPDLESLQRIAFKYVDRSPYSGPDFPSNQKEIQLKQIDEVERNLNAEKINATTL